MPGSDPLPGGVRRRLRCPICGGELAPSLPDPEAGADSAAPPAPAAAPAAAALRCGRGHAFDIARQGYVNLLAGSPPAGAETAGMVSARADLLDAGHFDFLTAQLAWIAAELAPSWPRPSGLVVDAGAGTGHHLARVLDRLTSHEGIALDVAKAAARRAARAHERAGAAVCDVWRGLPLADACADLVLDIFAPRNGAEFRRVLRDSGALVVVTPRPEHLGEIVRALGLIGVDPDKDRRVDQALGRWFALDRHERHGRRLILTRAEAARLVAMGPSAWHIDAERIASRLARLAEPVEVSACVDLRLYRPRP